MQGPYRVVFIRFIRLSLQHRSSQVLLRSRSAVCESFCARSAALFAPVSLKNLVGIPGRCKKDFRVCTRSFVDMHIDGFPPYSEAILFDVSTEDIIGVTYVQRISSPKHRCQCCIEGYCSTRILDKKYKTLSDFIVLR